MNGMGHEQVPAADSADVKGGLQYGDRGIY